MKSIRLSLIAYFLLLLGGALGFVSWLVFRTSAQALQARQDTNRQLLEQKYEQRRQEEMKKLDSELLHNAYTLASVAQSQFLAHRIYYLQYTQLGMFSAAVSPYAHITLPVWISEGHRTRLSWWLHNEVATEMRINEDLLNREEEKSTDFFQINSLRGKSWRSQSLGTRSLPFNVEQFNAMQLYDWQFDEVEWEPNQLVRRVMLKAPIARFRYSPPPPTPKPEGGSFNPPGSRSKGGSSKMMPKSFTPPATTPPQPMDRESISPPMFIQCAATTAQRDQAIATLEAELAEQLRSLDDEARATRSGILMRLLWINLATFVALIAGGSMLIGLGLAPLRRLSDAVSRVSEKDFQLHFEGPSPPKELVPIIERLRQSLTLLQRAFDREKQATADISHELRTPLAGLLATIEVALRKPRASEEYRQSLTECREIVKQMTQMVERLLALNWLDSRSDAVRPQAVDAVELAEQCAAVVRPLARVHGLNLTVHNGQPVPITTDPDKLREVLSNLMHNAIEYNQPDGSVDVYVRPCEGGAELEVKDTGIGIAADQRDKIFERFFRADPSRHATGLHAGLGLSIVHGYVQLMGGTISVDSEPGRGSTFRVRLPSLTATDTNGAGSS